MKKEKFDFSKFILDCFICFGLMIVSSIVFFIPIREILYVIDKSASFTVTACIIDFFSIILVVFLNFFHNIHKLSCAVACISLVVLGLFLDYYFSHYFIK